MQLISITKNFDGLTALDSVSAEFDAGRVYVLAGPNGAGKTTLLRIIAGLLPPTSGKVLFAPHPNPLPRGERGRGEGVLANALGVMMHESYLYRDLTPRENLELYAKLYGVSSARVAVVQDLLELSPFFNHDVATLSHGQRQRTSLARALLHDPKISRWFQRIRRPCIDRNA